MLKRYIYVKSLGHELSLGRRFYFGVNSTNSKLQNIFKHIARTFSYFCKQFENVKVDFHYLRGLSYKNAMKFCLD